MCPYGAFFRSKSIDPLILCNEYERVCKAAGFLYPSRANALVGAFALVGIAPNDAPFCYRP